MESHLIDNGLDFIVRAANDLMSGDLIEDQQSKYSTVELFEGVELLLKARLAREHWSLIVKDLDKYKYNSFENGSFISVSFETICERLNSFCKVQIDESARQSFDQLRKLRNRYVHFACKESYTSVISIQLKAWHHLLAMLENGFLDNLTNEQEEVLDYAKQLMMHSDEYLNTRYNEVTSQIEDAISEGRYVANCPMCGKPSLLIGGSDPSCPVCGKKEIDPTDAAEEYARANNPFWKHPRHGVDDEIELCDECDRYAVVPIGDDLREQAESVLLQNNKRNPGDDWEIKICFHCGDLTFK